MYVVPLSLVVTLEFNILRDTFFFKIIPGKKAINCQ